MKKNLNGAISMSEYQFWQKFQNKVEIGQGIQGKVYKATLNKKQDVAIKQFFRPNKRQNFHYVIREVSILKKLKHENIMRLYDCYVVDNSKYFMVSQFCQGGTLKEYVQNNKLSNKQNLRLCYQVTAGLNQIQKHKIVHRDLKPDNIFLKKDHKIKIGDFGLARTMEDEGNSSSIEEMLKSNVGTPAYMDPNVKTGQYTKKADIYSLGLVFAFILRRKGLFDHFQDFQSFERYLSYINSNYQENLSKQLGDIDPFMKDIIIKCLQNTQKERKSTQQIMKILQPKKSSCINTTSDPLSEQALNSGIYYELPSQSSSFQIKLIAFCDSITLKERQEVAKKELMRLLVQHQNNIKLISELKHLWYVEKETKQYFGFMVLFYYNFWLQKMLKLITNNQDKQSSLGCKYPSIDANILNKKTIKYSQNHINSEKLKIEKTLLIFAKNISSRLSLKSHKYKPQRFNNMVNQIIKYGINYNSKDYQLQNLMFSMSQMFQKRLVQQYNYNKGKECQDDSRLTILRDMVQNFR